MRILVALAALIVASAAPALALPVPEVGIQTGPGTYAPYAPSAITRYGIDRDTGQATTDPFTLGVGGAYKQANTISLGGAYTGTYRGVSYSFDRSSPHIDLAFHSGAGGAVLMATMLQSEMGTDSIGFTSDGSYAAPAQIATRTGSLTGGFPNNHFPVGLENTLDFNYFDLETTFGNNRGGVVNFASPADSGNGEIRSYDTVISAYSFVHFDLMAKLIDTDYTRLYGGKVTILDADLVNSPGAKDVTYAAASVPEPGTFLLLGAGLVGIARWGRKKFRK